MNDQLVPRLISKLFIPFILLFGLYVVAHGEISPGGGFQGGVILACAYILYALVFGLDQAQEKISPGIVEVCAGIGVLMYAGVGVVAMAMGGKFMEYSAMFESRAGFGQSIGINVAEYGVAMTVCAVMMLIFNLVAGASDDE